MSEQNLTEPTNPIFPEHARIYLGNPEQTVATRIKRLPPPPPWRSFARNEGKPRGSRYMASPEEIDIVNAALYLRRPILLTGKPGTGKSSLAHAVALELDLGPVLIWPITTRSTLQEGLYRYDAIARLQDASLRREAQQLEFMERTSEKDGAVESRPRVSGNGDDPGQYIRLGPLGTAFLGLEPLEGETRKRPRVLLIDEIDKSDVDLPNDLLNLFEEGQFEIPELSRLPQEERYEKCFVGVHDAAANTQQERVPITRGMVPCDEFPLVIMTSNAEREFPPAFLRRSLRLRVEEPNEEKLREIVYLHLKPEEGEVGQRSWPGDQAVNDMVKLFYTERNQNKRSLATDQLLNAVFLLSQQVPVMEDAKDEKTTQITKNQLREVLFRSLSETGG